jgi:hypothetical protein
VRALLHRVERSIAATSLVAIAFIVTTHARAYAQSTEAEALFVDGERLMKQGKLGEACEAFAASNRIESRAGTLVNLGMCRERNGQLASAWSAYKDSLTRVKDPKKQQIANERIAAIEPRLSYLTISVPDESRVDGLTLTRDGALVDPVLWNRAVPIDGGRYVIAGRAPGHEQWSTTVEVPNEQGKISVEVPRFKDLKQLITTDAPKPEVEPADDEEEPEAAPGTFTTKRKIALGLAGVGVAAIAGGIVLGMQAKKFEDDAFALCPDPSSPCPDGDRANDLISKGQSRALFANVSYGAAAASLIGAGVLWFVGAPANSETAVAVTPRLGSGTAGIDLRVRF